MNVSEAMARVLAGRGVGAFFGLIGSGNLAFTNALVAAGAPFYGARHENAAVSMADGYARASGKVGVVSVHQGPGFTNLLTGLTEAAKSRTPVLVLAADTPPNTLWSNFKVDQAAMARTTGAIAERVRSPETAAEDAARALRRVRVERRPVVLNVPIDLVDAPCDAPEVGYEPPDVEAPGPSAGSVAALADLLEASERPVLLAGRGAAGARADIEALGDQTGAVLATSAVANGLFAGSRYAVGISGGFASPFAAELFSRADAVVSFGATMNHWTTRHGSLFSSAKVAQVDLEPDAIGALRRADLGVVGDAGTTARAVADELERRGVRKEGFRSGDLAREIPRRRWRDEPYEDRGTPERMDPRTLSIALDDLLPSEKTVSVDSGHFLGYPPMYLDVPDDRGFVFPNAFQCVGLGLAAGIGAAVARPDRLSVATVGDGGALMALGELETIARYGIPMLVVVYNDAAYGAEVHLFAETDHATDLVRFPDADLAALARAAGAEGITVRNKGDLIGPLEDWLARRDGPLVVDAKTNGDVQADWIVDARRAH